MATPSLAMIPSAIADSKVYSVLPNNGDGDFTFNRDSSATRVGQNGLIQTVGYFGSELITNGDFATDSDWTKGTSWTISGGVANYDNVASQGFYQAKVLLASVVYKVTFDYTGTGQIGFYGTSNGSNVLKTYTNYAGGSNTIYITPTSTTSSFTLWGNVTGAFTVDNVSVKEVLGDQPRLNYDISNGVVQSCPSLLLEPASTNVIPYSEDFSNAAWSKTNLTVTDNQTTSPDGSLNASKLTEDTSTGEHKIFDSLSITSGVDYTFSVFVKSNGRNFIRLRLENAGVGSGQINVWFDVLNGTVGTVGAGTAIIENYGNGWYRCIATGTTSATSYVAQINLSDADNNVSYTGDGASGIYLFGAMLEELSYATSYIPTLSGAIQTRAAESCFGAGTSSTFNSEEGVLYAEISALANDSTNRVITISDGSTSNRVQVYFNSSNGITGGIIVGGSGQAAISYTINIESYLKLAFKYKLNDFALWVNGIEVGVDTVGSIPTGLNIIDFDNGAGGSNFYGNTKDIRVFNEALTDAQLQTLTTL